MTLKEKFITKSPLDRLYKSTSPIIGLTGGIASGKSTITNLLREDGHNTICADQLVKNIYGKTETIELIKTKCPEAVENEKINFPLLREKFFNNAELKSTVELFIYSNLEEEFQKQLSSFPNKEVVFYDVPLLFEKSMQNLVDLTVCVYTPKDLQLQRLKLRDNISDELAMSILGQQMDIEEKRTKSYLTLMNTGDLNHLKTEYDEMISHLF